MNNDPHRLPRTVLPTRYELTLTPELTAGTFTGTCTTEVEVGEHLEEIVLNAADLAISEAWVEQAGSEGRRVSAEVRLDAAHERAHLLLGAEIEPGTWYVVTRFSGVLNEQLRGFYRSSYTDDEGNEQLIATTQMEATHARRAFPCWDEPDLKAVFAVTLVVDDAHLAISNAAELRRTPTPEGRVAVQFADTMVMSTYLVAFVVGPLAATPPVDVGNVDLRIICRPDRLHLTEFALEVGAFALAWFEDYYGIVYPGGKLDLVAIPDFAFGAMENTGCVTFREVLLLVDPATVSQPELQRVVDVISHEIAHMWFGNLVTMRWWNGIWLNEAFATFMETSCTDAYRPDWKRWVTFGLERSSAFEVDALGSTRPIEYEVVSPEDAEGMFDVLTYEKGGAVLRMLEQYLSPDAFRAGVRRYLHAHQFANTETTDLWDAIEAATDEPVRRLMDTWIFQGGFPVVHATRSPAGLRLRQERFAYLPEARTTTRWEVPLAVAHRHDGGPATRQRVLLEQDATEVPLPDGGWVHVDAGAHGFLRVQYSEELLAAVLGHLGELDAAERFALVDDRWSLVLAGSVGAADFVSFCDAWSAETDLAVWQRLLAGLAAVDRLLATEDPARQALAAHIGHLVAPARTQLRELGDGADDRTRQLRGVLLGAAAVQARDPDARAEVAAVWDRHHRGAPDLDPALVAAAVDAMAEDGDAPLFDRFWSHYRNARSPQEELRFLGALADFPDPELIDRLLRATLTDQVRTQNAPYVVRRALANRHNGTRAWRFVCAEWDAIGSRFPTNSIARMLEGIRTLTDGDTAGEVAAFLADHEVPQGALTVTQHLERLRVHVALRDREHPRLRDALLA